MNQSFDLLVIGGGVNGAGIARDAAGRGLRVLLCEKGDLGEGTSSRSSKLIHGGLRYLEHYEFRLVREALREREVLLRIAPHIVRPMRFVLVHGGERRPAWKLRLGLFLYDHLGGRERLPGSQRLDLRTAPEGEALQDSYQTGFAYADCWVEDSRLVVLNALDAARRGASVLVGTEVVAARRDGDGWTAAMRGSDGTTQEVRARALVNAAGPWVERVMDGVVGSAAARKMRLVKGSHIVVRKFWRGEQAYLLQHEDGRVIFVLPYEGDLGLIGTTDIAYAGAPEEVAVSDQERGYLLGAVNRSMRPLLTRADIVAEFAGIRPLYDADAAEGVSAVSRDYRFEVEAERGRPALLSVFGGKITTYRRLAEHALDRLARHLPAMGPRWTAGAALPGGEMAGADFAAFLGRFTAEHGWLPPGLAEDYARRYGTRAAELLAGAGSRDALGRHFGGRLYEREAMFLRRTEWARRAEDVLERRTRHGLHLTAAERAAFAAWWSVEGVGGDDN